MLPELVPPCRSYIERIMGESEFVAFALETVAEQDYACFLDSAGSLGPRSVKSLLSGPVHTIFRHSGDRVLVQNSAGSTEISYERFRCFLRDFHKAKLGFPGPVLFPLITYEAYNPFHQPKKPHPLRQGSEAVWFYCEHVYLYDRNRGILTAPVQTTSHLPKLVNQEETKTPPLGWRETESGYHAKIRVLQRHIYDGVFYQANLSRRYVQATELSPITIYQRLRETNPSPFMGIFRDGAEWVLSGSPERLVYNHQRLLRSRPIAGTRPRFSDPSRDRASQAELAGSEKEAAEHLMLVDLIRNDLGSIAKPGSVSVEEYAVIETYSHVHHLVSEVIAELAEGKDVHDMIAAMHPGGTITGAPKISCIRRLSELEEEARGPYTGSIGYLTSEMEMDLNILIRTLIQKGNHICLHAGGGIVADSVEAAEYSETYHKAAALLKALGIQVPEPQ